MGCFFSKCRSSLILNKSGTMPPNTVTIPPNTHVQRIDQTNSNGIARVPKLNLGNHDEVPPPRNDRALLRMKPPPPGPRLDTSPRPILTAPRSPEIEHSVIDVQYAEDLRPVNLIPSEFPNSPKSHRESSVTVSDVRLNPTLYGLKRTSSTRRKEELSIEDLDTDCDDYNTLSNIRYSDNERLNPPTTDILLPRRKDATNGSKQKHKPNPENHFKSANSNRTKETTSGNVTGRNDTPMPRHLFVKNKSNLKPDSLTTIDITREQTETKEITSGNVTGRNDTPIPRNLYANNKRYLKPDSTTIDIIREQTEVKDNTTDVMITMVDETRDSKYEVETKLNITKHDTPGFNYPSSKIKIGDRVRDTYTWKDLDKSEERTDLQLQTDSNSQSYAALIESPKKMYDKEMEKKRQKRKRKRGTNQRQENIPGKLNDNETSSQFVSMLNDRPESNTSKWTLDSKLSFGSNVTINSLEMETPESSGADRYSYIQTNSTPISFKALTMDIDDAQAEIIDLEDEHEDPNNSSWLEDSNHDNDKQIDGWYGVKPYEVFTSTSGRDSGIITEIEREPSSSEIVTKKKLLYSRFSRRPQSETLLRTFGKPPLPPGAGNKVRPVSDTGQRTSRNFSRYFTTNLDKH